MEKEKFLVLLFSKDIYWKKKNKKKVNRIKRKYKNKPTYKEYLKTLNYNNLQILSEKMNFHV
jgi:preprotein translocase subunit Sss1